MPINGELDGENLGVWADARQERDHGRRALTDHVELKDGGIAPGCILVPDHINQLLGLKVVTVQQPPTARMVKGGSSFAQGGDHLALTRKGVAAPREFVNGLV